jgi:F0F1-type ATP synthase assembly protein I
MGNEQEKPKAGTGQGAAEAWRRAGPYLDASWSLVGSVGLWTALGYWLDRWLHTRPWLLVSGSVLGMGLGFYLFFKALLAIGKRNSDGK